MSTLLTKQYAGYILQLPGFVNCLTDSLTIPYHDNHMLKCHLKRLSNNRKKLHHGYHEIPETDKMAERSKALRSGRSPLLWAWISESKFFHYAVTVSISLLKYCSSFCSA
ncbi:hypothetical protein T03_7586 [Trichinella britovi]|uniref:Uncharacterized protein n=1 Tax=Trichinella britovi TaxID=45882 RepID=A0A0V1CEK7_TRIBR|nr:hypothetical protein T03_7586 [Trichinella britovi]